MVPSTSFLLPSNDKSLCFSVKTIAIDIYVTTVYFITTLYFVNTHTICLLSQEEAHTAKEREYGGERRQAAHTWQVEGDGGLQDGGGVSGGILRWWGARGTWCPRLLGVVEGGGGTPGIHSCNISHIYNTYSLRFSE